MIITITNNKGGSGKTTTLRNLIYLFQQDGKKILSIDLDPQCNLSDWYSTDFDSEVSVSNVLINQSCADAIQKAERGDVIKGDANLKNALKHLEELDGDLEVTSLKRALEKYRDYYDIIFIDTSPFYNTATSNAIMAADLIIIPTKIDYDNASGAINTINEIHDFSKAFNIEIPYKILVNMKTRTKYVTESTIELRELFGDKVFKNEIRYQENPISMATATKKAVCEAFPKKAVSEDYINFFKELKDVLMMSTGE